MFNWQVFAYAMISAGSAASGVTNLNHTGIRHTALPNFCKYLHSFCDHVAISIAFTFFSCILLAMSAVQDVIWLSKNWITSLSRYAILYKNDLQDIICIVLSLQMINILCSHFVIQGTYCSFVRNEMIFINYNGNVVLYIDRFIAPACQKAWANVLCICMA